MAGIYKLKLKNGKTYHFTIQRNVLVKNLFNIDSKDIIERIERIERIEFSK
jgi:hypothetical protein